ncbi:NADPH-dependent FMN reductase [Neobacillus niacini]|uniref:NADPH-dependent FMN reductase n=1 Tax=Neobacillus niacini TaxID=86668 RepID=UPI002FFEA9D4
MRKVGIIVGSLRKESRTKQIAKNVATLFPKGYEIEFVEIGNLTLYNQDYDTIGSPPEYSTYRSTMKGMDAVLFVTPEHNRTIPAALKNALDIGSRPYGQSIWDGKPAAIISQSQGNISGFGANHHLRQSLTVLNMPILQQPEAYLSNVASLLDENGKINNEGTVQFLQTFINAFVDLINRYKA